MHALISFGFSSLVKWANFIWLFFIEVFESWQGKFGRHCNIDLWRLVPHCLMWCIWRERKARCFKGCEQSLLEIKSFFLHTLLVWSVALSHFSCFSLPLLLDHCNFGSWFLPPHYISNVLGFAIFLLINIFIEASMRYCQWEALIAVVHLRLRYLELFG